MKNLKNSSLDYIAIFEHCVYDKETVYLHFISDIRQRLCIHLYYGTVDFCLCIYVCVSMHGFSLVRLTMVLTFIVISEYYSILKSLHRFVLSFNLFM